MAKEEVIQVSTSNIEELGQSHVVLGNSFYTESAPTYTRWTPLSQITGCLRYLILYWECYVYTLNALVADTMLVAIMSQVKVKKYWYPKGTLLIP